jgi:hypothetical protein
MNKKINLSPELSRLMQDQLSAFRMKFGRDPGPDDPVFFDPDSETPKPLSLEKQRRVVTDAAERAGLDPDQLLAALRIDE